MPDEDGAGKPHAPKKKASPKKASTPSRGKPSKKKASKKKPSHKKPSKKSSSARGKQAAPKRGSRAGAKKKTRKKARTPSGPAKPHSGIPQTARLPDDPSRWTRGDWAFDPEKDRIWEDPTIWRRRIGTPEELEAVADAVVRGYALHCTDPDGNEREIVRWDAGKPNGILTRYAWIEELRNLIDAVQQHPVVRLARVETEVDADGFLRVTRRWVTDIHGEEVANAPPTKLAFDGSVVESCDVSNLDIAIELSAEARFKNDACFGQTRFAEAVWFARARFAGDASFMLARFTEVASFGQTRFDGEVSFVWALIANEASFAQTCFTEATALDQIRFSEGVRFNGALFAGRMSFEWVRFAGRAFFDGARFGEEASFAHAHFAEGASFVQTHFDGVARYFGTRFAGEASFGEVRFERMAWFNSARFAKEASFFKACFDGFASFGDTRFNRKVLFEQARFSGNASFEGAEFAEIVSFQSAIADHRLLLTRARFARALRLDNARFTGSSWKGDDDDLRTAPPPGLYLSESTSYERIVLRGARFSPRARLGIHGLLCLGDSTLEVDEDLILPLRRARRLARRSGHNSLRRRLRAIAHDILHYLGLIEPPAIVCREDSRDPDALRIAARDWELLASNAGRQSGTDAIEDWSRWRANELRRKADWFESTRTLARLPPPPATRPAPTLARMIAREFADVAAVMGSVSGRLLGFLGREILWRWLIERNTVAYMLDPRRIVASGAAITLCCALIFGIFASNATIGDMGELPEAYADAISYWHAPDLWGLDLSPLYFSLMTFVTLGYGDFAPIGWFKIVAASEALLGVTLLALFTVAWGRRMIR